MTVSIKELEYWNERILELVKEFGLNCYPQEFDICDHNEMIGYMAYSGMPSRYAHWSFGKSFEVQKTRYDLGVGGLPYEMVINSNPCLAYLMRDNTLMLQILTIAHVYGHNDFFANNFYFKHGLDAHYTLETFKNNARRVDSYLSDPSIGVDAVEAMLDNAHAISFQRNRNMAIFQRNHSEQKQQFKDNLQPSRDEYSSIHPKKAAADIPPEKFPIEPQENLLLFIADNNDYLNEWQKDLLRIVDRETMYFIPQMETKIMNEGWASYWHHKIMNTLNLDQGLHMEFMVRHSQVLTPHPGSINPYYLGFVLWNDIERRWNERSNYKALESDNPKAEIQHENQSAGRKKMFEVRETDRDISFLRRFLSEEVIREMDIFQHEQRGKDRVITKVADQQSWQEIKETLISNTGTNMLPVIKIEDADFGRKKTLYLKHYHDGRDLQLEHAEHSLRSTAALWGREVVMETKLNGQLTILKISDGSFKIEKP